MGIFEIEKYLLHITGLLLDDSLKEQTYNKLANVVLILPFLPMIYGSASYLVEEARSVIDFTEALYTIAVFVLLSVYYIIFTTNKLEMNRLFIDLEKTTVASKPFL